MRKRNHVIPIRLNTKEMKHLETQVAVSGLNREEYLRTLILGAECVESLVSIMQICCGKLQDCVIMRISWHTLPMQQELPVRRLSNEMLRISRKVWEEVREMW